MIHQKQVFAPWVRPVKGEVNFVTTEPGTPAFGDTYVNTTTGTSSGTAQAVVAQRIYKWDGSAWAVEIPADGMLVMNVATNKLRQFDATVWATPIGSTEIVELLAPTAQNTIPNLSAVPVDVNDITFYVNGMTVDTLAGSGISVAGQAVTVTPATLGFDVETTDRVVAKYLS
jgi:Protein of unknown function (DUF2793)